MFNFQKEREMKNSSNVINLEKYFVQVYRDFIIFIRNIILIFRFRWLSDQITSKFFVIWWDLLKKDRL